MTPAAIIFDFDGVIVDSEIASNQSFARVLTAAGMPTSIDEVCDLYLGRNWTDTLAAMTARWGALVPDDIHERISADYRASTAGRTTPVPGVLGFVGRVAHLPMAVASSSASDYIRAGLSALGIAHHFGDHVYSGREHVARGKPFPDLYLHAAAALAAGARVFGLAAGRHARPSLSAALAAEGVERVFASYADMAAHLALAPRA